MKRSREFDRKYIKRNRHSAIEDAYILKAVCNKKSEVFNPGYTFQDILHHFDQKLLLPIQMVYSLAAGCSSHQELTFLLHEYVKPKTALNLNQVCKVGSRDKRPILAQKGMCCVNKEQ